MKSLNEFNAGWAYELKNGGILLVIQQDFTKEQMIVKFFRDKYELEEWATKVETNGDPT